MGSGDERDVSSEASGSDRLFREIAAASVAALVGDVDHVLSCEESERADLAARTLSHHSPAVATTLLEPVSAERQRRARVLLAALVAGEQVDAKSGAAFIDSPDSSLFGDPLAAASRVQAPQMRPTSSEGLQPVNEAEAELATLGSTPAVPNTSAVGSRFAQWRLPVSAALAALVGAVGFAIWPSGSSTEDLAAASSESTVSTTQPDPVPTTTTVPSTTSTTLSLASQAQLWSESFHGVTVATHLGEVIDEVNWLLAIRTEYGQYEPDLVGGSCYVERERQVTPLVSSDLESLYPAEMFESNGVELRAGDLTIGLEGAAAALTSPDPMLKTSLMTVFTDWYALVGRCADFGYPADEDMFAVTEGIDQIRTRALALGMDNLAAVAGTLNTDPDVDRFVESTTTTVAIYYTSSSELSVYLNEAASELMGSYVPDAAHQRFQDQYWAQEEASQRAGQGSPNAYVAAMAFINENYESDIRIHRMGEVLIMADCIISPREHC